MKAAAALATNHSSSPERIASVDIIRGLTIMVMLFVNDLAGVTGAPAWMKHIRPSSADGMTFVDVVFPAFLFIVGMAIPLATERRLQQGDSITKLYLHVIIRTASLLVIGFFMVNSESISSATAINTNLWVLLMYAAFILIWFSIPRSLQKRGKIVSLCKICLGLVILVALALLYRRGNMEGAWQMRPSWWGIIGLIGWAYFMATTLYLPCRNNLPALVGLMAILYCFYFADKAGLLSGFSALQVIIGDPGGTLGSHAAIVMSGIILGMMLTPDAKANTNPARIKWALVYAGLLALAAFLLHTLNDLHRMFIINKIAATPVWCLYCSAITIVIWAAIHLVTDVLKAKSWAVWLYLAGANALFAYLLQPIFLATLALCSLGFYDKWGGTFAVGFWRSVTFAVAMTLLTGLLKRIGYFLKV